MLISAMPPVTPIMNTASTITYNFPSESGHLPECGQPKRQLNAALKELNATLNLNFRIGRGIPALSETIKQLEALKQWPADWNGYDAAAPNPKSIAEAKLYIRQMCMDAVHSTATWQDPHITADANGDVVFEWWKDSKKLTIYVSPTTMEYVKVWGPDITHQMADGEIESAVDRRDLWLWFVD